MPLRQGFTFPVIWFYGDRAGFDLCSEKMESQWSLRMSSAICWAAGDKGMESVIDGVRGVLWEIEAGWGVWLVPDDVEYVVCEGGMGGRAWRDAAAHTQQGCGGANCVGAWSAIVVGSGKEVDRIGRKRGRWRAAALRGG